jgi:hypothetical protein
MLCPMKNQVWSENFISFCENVSRRCHLPIWFMIHRLRPIHPILLILCFQVTVPEGLQTVTITSTTTNRTDQTSAVNNGQFFITAQQGNVASAPGTDTNHDRWAPPSYPGSGYRSTSNTTVTTVNEESQNGNQSPPPYPVVGDPSYPRPEHLYSEDPTQPPYATNSNPVYPPTAPHTG